MYESTGMGCTDLKAATLGDIVGDELKELEEGSLTLTLKLTLTVAVTAEDGNEMGHSPTPPPTSTTVADPSEAHGKSRE